MLVGEDHSGATGQKIHLNEGNTRSGSDSKETTFSARDMHSISGLRDPLERGNSKDRVDWWATAHAGSQRDVGNLIS